MKISGKINVYSVRPPPPGGPLFTAQLGRYRGFELQQIFFFVGKGKKIQNKTLLHMQWDLSQARQAYYTPQLY